MNKNPNSTMNDFRGFVSFEAENDESSLEIIRFVKILMESSTIGQVSILPKMELKRGALMEEWLDMLTNLVTSSADALQNQFPEVEKTLATNIHHKVFTAWKKGWKKKYRGNNNFFIVKNVTVKKIEIDMCATNYFSFYISHDNFDELVKFVSGFVSSCLNLHILHLIYVGRNEFVEVRYKHGIIHSWCLAYPDDYNVSRIKVSEAEVADRLKQIKIESNNLDR